MRSLGAFIGPLITGLLHTRIGFHYGFGAAATGMALGLVQYVAFRRNLGTDCCTVPNPLPRSTIGWLVDSRHHGGLRNLRIAAFTDRVGHDKACAGDISGNRRGRFVT